MGHTCQWCSQRSHNFWWNIANRIKYWLDNISASALLDIFKMAANNIVSLRTIHNYLAAIRRLCDKPCEILHSIHNQCQSLEWLGGFADVLAFHTYQWWHVTCNSNLECGPFLKVAVQNVAETMTQAQNHCCRVISKMRHLMKIMSWTNYPSMLLVHIISPQPSSKGNDGVRNRAFSFLTKWLWQCINPSLTLHKTTILNFQAEQIIHIGI